MHVRPKHTLVLTVMERGSLVVLLCSGALSMIHGTVSTPKGARASELCMRVVSCACVLRLGQL